MDPADPSSATPDPADPDTEPTEPASPAGKWVWDKTVEYKGDGSVSSRWEGEYDAAGNMVRERMYGPDESLYLRDEFEYDAAGRVTKFERYGSMGMFGGDAEDFHLMKTETHAYDDAGNEIRYVLDGELQWEAEYDAFATRIRYLDYYEDEVSYFEECETDASGRTVRIRQQWGNGEERCWIPEYDASGLERKAVQYDPDGIAQFYLDMEYDAAGNMTKRVNRQVDGPYEEREEWEYDAAGNQIKYVENDILRKEKTYDAAGNLTKDTDYDEDGRIAQIEIYEYDEAGNMIKDMICGKDGEPEKWMELSYIWISVP